MTKNGTRQPSTLEQKAVQAMRKAVRNVIREHRRTGRPLYFWKNGKVVKEVLRK